MREDSTRGLKRQCSDTAPSVKRSRTVETVTVAKAVEVLRCQMECPPPEPMELDVERNTDSGATNKSLTTVTLELSPKPRRAPLFEGTAVLPDGSFSTVTSSGYLGKPLVLLFYPLDFAPVSGPDVLSLNERVDDLWKLGCEVLACSVDSQYTHLAWVQHSQAESGLGGSGSLRFPLLSDFTKRISKDFGVLDEACGISSRALFILDSAQNIRFSMIHDLPDPFNADDIIRLVANI